MSASPRVLAIAERDGSVTLVRDRCASIDCAVTSELVEERVVLPPAIDVDQILMTADGGHLLVRSEARTLNIELDPDTSDAAGYRIIEGPGGIESLVGALRGGRHVVLRDSMGLISYDVETQETVRIGDGDMDLLALALGDRHLVARRMLGDGDEELYLIPVAPDPRNDELRPGRPIRLAHGAAVTRVAITRVVDDASADGRARDGAVVVTMGEDPRHARTAIFDVSDGRMIDAFDGAVITSFEPLHDIDGLYPISPDGSAVAYITPRASVAVHRVGGGSCLVRSARSGEHKLAGFAADGRLFFEAFEANRSGVSHDRVYTHKLGDARYEPLTPDDRSFHLQAVPARAHVDPELGALPWAVAAREGRSHAVQPGATPLRLPYDDVSFMPRRRQGFSEDTLWLFEATDDGGSPATRIDMRRLLPVDASGGSVRFEDPKDAPIGCASESCGDEDPASPFTRVFGSEVPVCLATSRSVGWARGCIPAAKRRSLVRTRLPESETPLE